jgi:hypothetical protein
MCKSSCVLRCFGERFFCYFSHLAPSLYADKEEQPISVLGRCQKLSDYLNLLLRNIEQV